MERSRLIPQDKSVIVACDVPFQGLSALVHETIEVPGISAYKVGPQVALGQGLAEVTQVVKDLSEIGGPCPRLIYDHQKAGNDIPAFGTQLMDELAAALVDAVILFPFAGPATQEAWTKAAFELGLTPITGGEMTHERFLVSEGGYIADESPERIYRLAAQLGVVDFVVPGTKPEKVIKYKGILEEELGEGGFTLYAPGFISQGGDITEVGQVAGSRFHAIVGSGIYKAGDMNQAALTVTSQINALGAV